MAEKSKWLERAGHFNTVMKSLAGAGGIAFFLYQCYQRWGGWTAFFVSLLAYPLTWWFVWRKWGPMVAERPAFRDYTEDSFDGLRYRWSWSDEHPTPSPDAILDLTPLCPECGIRITPFRMTRMRRGVEPPFVRVVEGEFIATDDIPICIYACPDNCFNETRDVHCNLTERKVRLWIEKKARMHGRMKVQRPW